MSSNKPTDLVNVDFWADRLAALIKLAEHYGVTVEIAGGELVVSRQVSDAFIAQTEVRWRTADPVDDVAPASVAGQPPADTGEEARTVCVCSHTKGEHITVSGRLLCDSCDPNSTDNLVCKGFDAL